MKDTKTIQECYNLVNDYFHGNTRKIWHWFQYKNPALGGVSALDMIKSGRSKKLLAFIKGHNGDLNNGI